MAGALLEQRRCPNAGCQPPLVSRRSTLLLQQLVGGEPAAFFLDACRLMDGDYALEATTHVVGHLLRELDNALRAVLRPIVPDDRWPPRNSEAANGKQVVAQGSE